MAGEHILVVDDSVAVQELCRTALESRGYRVTLASNGIAAMSYPELGEVDVLVIDTHLRDVTGLDTTKAFKKDEELFRKPILLLVPDGETETSESQETMGASAYLRKPFDPAHLAAKIQLLLEERDILERGREYLKSAADSLMKRLAEENIQQAVEQKTQIIIERALQMVVTHVDARARREVDAKVTQLTSEKEQELVKLTVHEVARSMVEKLAERKVSEAMDAILRDETEKAVRRMAESILPGLTRDRIREYIDQTLPKEVQRRVQKEAENLVPEASQKVVSVIEAAAQKLVPKIGRDIVTELAQRQLSDAIDQQLPRHVQHMVGQELEAQIRLKIAPLVKEAADKINARTKALTIGMLGILIAGMVFVFVTWISANRSGSKNLENTERVLPAPTKATPGSALQQLMEKVIAPPKKNS